MRTPGNGTEEDSSKDRALRRVNRWMETKRTIKEAKDQMVLRYLKSFKNSSMLGGCRRNFVML